METGTKTVAAARGFWKQVFDMAVNVTGMYPNEATMDAIVALAEGKEVLESDENAMVEWFENMKTYLDGSPVFDMLWTPVSNLVALEEI